MRCMYGVGGFLLAAVRSLDFDSTLGPFCLKKRMVRSNLNVGVNNIIFI